MVSIRERAAHHEAAHVVLAYYLTGCRNPQCVTLNPDGSGAVSFGSAPDPQSLSPKQVHDECIGALAGIEYELLKFGTAEIDHSETDRRWAHSCSAPSYPNQKNRDHYLKGLVCNEMPTLLASVSSVIDELAQELIAQGTLIASEIQALLDPRRPPGI